MRSVREDNAYVENANFVNALGLGVGLRCQVLVNVFEVGDGYVLLEFFVQHDVVVDELDLASLVRHQTASGALGVVVARIDHINFI